jgi:hypothetical protein
MRPNILASFDGETGVTMKKTAAELSDGFSFLLGAPLRADRDADR